MSTRYLLRHCQYANPRNIIVGRLPVVYPKRGEAEAAKLRRVFCGDKTSLKCIAVRWSVASKPPPLLPMVGWNYSMTNGFSKDSQLLKALASAVSDRRGMIFIVINLCWVAKKLAVMFKRMVDLAKP